MAHLELEFLSASLVRPTRVEVFLPNDLRNMAPGAVPGPPNPHYARKTKTLFVLHGYTGWGRGWSAMYELGARYNLALVFPTGENSFYLDGEANNAKFGTLVGVELVEYLQKTLGLCQSRDDTFITGLSMGGFGALHVGLSQSERFSQIAALSSALILRQVAGMKEGEGNEVANYSYYRNCFGDLDRVLESEKNPETLVTKLLNEKKQLPRIYLACGTEDFLLENNREFHSFLLEKKVDHSYVEGPGGHDMSFWNQHFAKAVEWMLAGP
ncbi:MAG: alpha/beta hydrolase-fold protein [Treponema sp.]|nr:alpha/beta hydrolase-fold protein [Treponema sp.]